jgi:peptidoglycan/LPS O-acetylase OafA/YrhL
MADTDGAPYAVPDVMDGSLWTLFYEAVCYATVVGLGILGVLRRRCGLTFAVVALLWFVTALNAIGIVPVPQERMLRFALMFLTGAASRPAPSAPTCPTACTSTTGRSCRSSPSPASPPPVSCCSSPADSPSRCWPPTRPGT